MSNLKYIIWNANLLHDDINGCGGCIALATLFENLKDLGVETYLAIKIDQRIPGLKSYKDEDFFSLADLPNVENTRNLDLDECVVIYPEVTKGNPLNCKNVVRWLLHAPDVIVQGTSEFYGSDDVLFAMEGWVKDMSESRGFNVEDEILKTLHIDFETFYDKKEFRYGTCYAIKKGWVDGSQIPDHSLNIEPFFNNPKALAEYFNKTECFYCYDDKSYLSILAALCGCDSVVVNTNNQTEKEYFDSRSNFWRYGVAYGINNLEHSRATKHLLKQELIKEQEVCLSTVKGFMDCMQNRHENK